MTEEEREVLAKKVVNGIYDHVARQKGCTCNDCRRCMAQVVQEILEVPSMEFPFATTVNRIYG